MNTNSNNKSQTEWKLVPTKIESINKMCNDVVVVGKCLLMIQIEIFIFFFICYFAYVKINKIVCMPMEF